MRGGKSLRKLYLISRYDAVYLNRNSGLVRFVQITCAATHSFKIGCFASLLDKLTEKSEIEEPFFPFQRLEIVFLVPTRNLSRFALKDSAISGQGNLELYGWKKDEE